MGDLKAKSVTEKKG